MCHASIHAAQHLLVRMTAAGHSELLATRPSRAAVAAVASFGMARARLFILRAKGALRDPWCIRSGSLTGSPGGCHCVRRGSIFEILSGKNSLLDVVTTTVPSADAASERSDLRVRETTCEPAGSTGASLGRQIWTTKHWAAFLYSTFCLWWGVFVGASIEQHVCPLCDCVP